MYNFSDPKFDPVFEEFYRFEPSLRNQKLLDSLYKKYNLPEEIGKSNWLQRFSFKNGSPPVIHDSTQSLISAKAIENFYKNHGFLDANVTHDLKKIGRKKVASIYRISPQKPLYIKEMEYNIPYSDILQLYEKNKKNSLIKAGNRLDQFAMDAEMNRFTRIARNNGYFDFNINRDEMFFWADTLEGRDKLKLELEIKKIKDSEDEKDYFQKYTYKDVIISVQNSFSDNENVSRKPSEKFNNYTIEPLNDAYKLSVFSDMMVIEPGKNYSLREQEATNRRIFSTNNFNLISSEITAKDSLLIAKYRIYPKLKYDLEFTFETLTLPYPAIGGDNTNFPNKTFNIGITPGVNLTVRNLFRGAENLNLSFSGTFGTIEFEDPSRNRLFNAFDLTFQSRLIFPRFWAPFGLKNKISKRFNPITDITQNASLQRNIGLGRISLGTSINYNLDLTESSKLRVSVFNNQFIKLLNPGNYFNVFLSDRLIRDNTFGQYFALNPTVGNDYNNEIIGDNEVIALIQNDLPFLNFLQGTNPALFDQFNLMNLRRARNTQDFWINSFITDYTYTEFRNPLITHPLFFQTKIEVGGNVISLLDNFFQFNGKIGGVAYSQFVKLELDHRQLWKVAPKSSLAWRNYFGIALPYNKSEFIPFDKSFFMGGANDIRAWPVFNLGPADEKNPNLAVENLKLLFSLEYRFKMGGPFEGALFVDAGNIWGINREFPTTLFKFEEFYNEIAIGTGWGIRYDLKYLMLRFDFGYKLADPTRDLGDRLRVENIEWFRPQVQFAINYPF